MNFIENKKNDSSDYSIRIIYLVAVLFLSCSAFGAITNASQLIRIGNTEIIELHAGVGSFTAKDRADAIIRRIDGLVSNHLFNVNSIVSADNGVSTDILAGDTLIASITDQDATAANLSRVELAEKTAEAIKVAIYNERGIKSPRQLLISSAFAALATVILIAILMLFGRFFPKFVSTLQSSKGTRIKSLRIRSFEILTAQRLTDFAVWLTKTLRGVLTIVLLYFYVPLVLSLFPWTANLAPQILDFIINPIHKIGAVFVDFLPNLFFIGIAIVFTRYILKFIQMFFSEIERGTLTFQGFYPEWAEPTYKLVRLIVLALALVVIFPYLPGSGSPAFQGVSVFLGVLLSFGSSTAIGNIVAGVVLTYMRPFKIGDRVKIADTVGDVVERTLLITKVKTIKNMDITIPNAMVLGSHIINYSSSAQSAGLILHTTVTIGYDVPWKQVHEILLRAALDTEDVVNDPKPFILQTSLDDFYVSYELNAYTRKPNSMAITYSCLHQNIQDQFNRAGVEIMSPHYSALRDGNEIAIPKENQPQGY